MSPDQPGFGQIVKPGSGKRRTRRNVAAGNTSESSKLDWTVISPAVQPSSYPPPAHISQGPGEPSNPTPTYSYPLYSARRPSDADAEGNWRLHRDQQQPGSPIPLHSPYGYIEQHVHRRPATASTSSSLPAHERRYVDGPESPNAYNHSRFSPYPSSRTRADPWRSSPRDLKEPTLLQPPSVSAYNQDERVLPSHPHFGPPENITLAPVIPPDSRRYSEGSFGGGEPRSVPLTLPPISALGHGVRDDPSAVLERLRSTSDDIDLYANARGSRDVSRRDLDIATSRRQMSGTPVESHNM